MKQYPLIGISIITIVILILASLTNVVGYQSVKSLENHAPDAPDIMGPQELKLGISYLFTFVTTDPDGDNVSYSIDWGDGNVILWAGPFKSGQVIKFQHTWTKKDTTSIKAKAKDLPYENESDWTIYPIRWSYSLSPQINYQNTFNNKVNQRELLFQTIVDIANNKEIQRIILKSQMSRGIFSTSEFPVVTKTHIRQMYFLGLILSKVISKSRMQSLIGTYQFNNQEIQREIFAVIEKDKTLSEEQNQLSFLNCDCQDSGYKDGKIIRSICYILFIITGLLFIPLAILQVIFQNTYLLHYLIEIPLGLPIFIIIACLMFLTDNILHCWDYWEIPHTINSIG